MLVKDFIPGKYYETGQFFIFIVTNAPRSGRDYIQYEFYDRHPGGSKNWQSDSKDYASGYDWPGYGEILAIHLPTAISLAPSDKNLYSGSTQTTQTASGTKNFNMSKGFVYNPQDLKAGKYYRQYPTGYTTYFIHQDTTSGVGSIAVKASHLDDGQTSWSHLYQSAPMLVPVIGQLYQEVSAPSIPCPIVAPNSNGATISTAPALNRMVSYRNLRCYTYYKFQNKIVYFIKQDPSWKFTGYYQTDKYTWEESSFSVYALDLDTNFLEEVPRPAIPCPLDSAVAPKAVAKPKPKPAIQANKTSPTCVNCKGVNKMVALFQFSTYYCPSCE